MHAGARQHESRDPAVACGLLSVHAAVAVPQASAQWRADCAVALTALPSAAAKALAPVLESSARVLLQDADNRGGEGKVHHMDYIPTRWP